MFREAWPAARFRESRHCYLAPLWSHTQLPSSIGVCSETKLPGDPDDETQYVAAAACHVHLDLVVRGTGTVDTKSPAPPCHAFDPYFTDMRMYIRVVSCTISLGISAAAVQAPTRLFSTSPENPASASRPCLVVRKISGSLFRTFLLYIDQRWPTSSAS